MLGFSLLKNSFQFVNIQYQDGKPVVSQFAKRATTIPFTQTSIFDENSRIEFRKLIEEAINYYHLQGPFALSLDSRFALIKKILMDLVLLEDQVETQMNWEIRQILPEESLKEFQYVYEELPGGYYENQKAILLVLFRKEILEWVQRLFAETPLELKYVELDLFSALYGTNRMFGIRDQELSFLVDLRKDSIQLLIARKGEYFDLHKISFTDESEGSETQVYESTETLGNLITKEIRRNLLDHNIESEERPIQSLFLYGEKATSDLASHLAENNLSKKTILLEPFKKLELSPDIERLPESSSEYAICVGSALRSVL